MLENMFMSPEKPFYKSTELMYLDRIQEKDYRNLLPSHQLRLLKAIAVEDGIEQPTSVNFINRNDLTSACSVSTSLKALADKEMIVFDHDKWQVVDVFLSRQIRTCQKD